MTTTPSNVITTLLAELKTQAIGDLIVPINMSLATIKATPDTQTVAAQGPQLLASIYAILPHLEAQGIIDLESALSTWVNSPSVAGTSAPAA